MSKRIDLVLNRRFSQIIEGDSVGAADEGEGRKAR